MQKLNENLVELEAFFSISIYIIRIRIGIFVYAIKASVQVFVITLSIRDCTRINWYKIPMIRIVRATFQLAVMYDRQLGTRE